MRVLLNNLGCGYWTTSDCIKVDVSLARPPNIVAHREIGLGPDPTIR